MFLMLMLHAERFVTFCSLFSCLTAGVLRVVHTCCCLALALSNPDTDGDETASEKEGERAEVSDASDRFITACARSAVRQIRFDVLFFFVFAFSLTGL